MKALIFAPILLLFLYPLKVGASHFAPKDTVIINGQVITIRADVEIDSIALSSSNWMEDADFAFLTRVNAGYSRPLGKQGDKFIHRSNTVFPEFGLELNRPFSLKKSKQLNYRFSASVGFAKRFKSEDLEPNVVGFNFNEDNNSIEQIVIIPDDLQSEYDTLSVPIYIKPHFKLNLGIEWHGIMRAARGWRFGAMIEYTPVKDQVVELEMSTVTLEEYQENGNKTDPELIYNQIPVQSNFLQLKSFASWSPWNSSIFIRFSILWSPNRKEAALTLGYYF